MRSLVLQIHQAACLFDRMLDPVLPELGLSMSELPILLTTAGRGRTTVAQLRGWFGYPGATASVAVRRLEAQQYVRVRHDAPDARLLAVYATRPGRAAAGVALARIREIEARIGRRTGPQAIDECLLVLDAARRVQLPRAMMDVAFPRRSRPPKPASRDQPSRRRSRARIAASSAGSA
jgi:DNA-binding MarR family transcriptional regulator